MVLLQRTKPGRTRMVLLQRTKPGRTRMVLLQGDGINFAIIHYLYQSPKTAQSLTPTFDKKFKITKTQAPPFRRHEVAPGWCSYSEPNQVAPRMVLLQRTKPGRTTDGAPTTNQSPSHQDGAPTNAITDPNPCRSGIQPRSCRTKMVLLQRFHRHDVAPGWCSYNEPNPVAPRMVLLLGRCRTRMVLLQPINPPARGDRNKFFT
jgi:hypothetical protein